MKWSFIRRLSFLSMLCLLLIIVPTASMGESISEPIPEEIQAEDAMGDVPETDDKGETVSCEAVDQSCEEVTFDLEVAGEIPGETDGLTAGPAEPVLDNENSPDEDGIIVTVEEEAEMETASAEACSAVIEADTEAVSEQANASVIEADAETVSAAASGRIMYNIMRK